MTLIGRHVHGNVHKAASDFEELFSLLGRGQQCDIKKSLPNSY